MASLKYLNTQFGDYYLFDWDKEKKAYIAKCNYCGEVRTFKTNSIIANSKYNKGSCNCRKAGISPGDKFGRLTVISRNFEKINNDKSIFWNCQCDCGNTTIVPSRALKNGNTKSCGCLMLENSIKTINKYNQEHFNDLSNQRFGKLIVVRLLTENEKIQYNKKNKSHYWLCQCDCGNTHIVDHSDLIRNKVKSCGCMLSQGEEKIGNILSLNNINYSKQYNFDDCVGKNNQKYKFDFAVFKNNQLYYLIEFDGIQHYDAKKQFNVKNPEQTFLQIQQRDKEKNEYCQKNNIPLIRIPYWHLQELKLEDLLLETSKFIL